MKLVSTRLFRRHYFVFVLIVLLFIFIGLAMNFLVMRLADRPKAPNPPTFFAIIIDRLNPGDRVKSLIEIEQMHQNAPPFSLTILDEKGRVVYPKGVKPNIDWNSIELPTKPYQFSPVHPEEGDEHHGPPEGIVRFQGEPVQYLLIGRAGHHEPPPFYFVILSTSLLVLSVLLGIGFALARLYNSVNVKVRLADSVISELQHGNLKARFPIKKRDEFAKAMKRFNMMADEIEHLVERLQTAEKSRMALLQDLAHDLRTPIASLKNVLETFEQNGEALERNAREELLGLALNEVSYFERLIEDLLVLAQVSEPKYQKRSGIIQIDALLEEEADQVESRLRLSSSPIEVRMAIPVAVEMEGEALLLRRMLRNALENAVSFARKKVLVSLNKGEGKVQILIQDDGPGFTEHSLANFGKRMMTRTLGSQKNGRLSVGLGSVIMNTVAELYRGGVSVRNCTDEQGNILGASVEITLSTT